MSESILNPYPRVQGKCPHGCGDTLFLGAGGHVTCSWLHCPDPAAADLFLRVDAGETVTLRRALERIRDYQAEIESDAEIVYVMQAIARDALSASLAGVRQVDPDSNPDYVMGPGDDVPRLATAEERAALGIRVAEESADVPDRIPVGNENYIRDVVDLARDWLAERARRRSQGEGRDED